MRTRSASPKSVSFSPVLERKYSVERAPNGPKENADLSASDWRRYFSDFSSYLGKCVEQTLVGMTWYESKAFIVRPWSISVACYWSVWEAIP